MSKNYTHMIPLLGILSDTWSLKIRKAELFLISSSKNSNRLSEIMLRPEKESLKSKLGGIARSLSVRKSGRRGSGQPIVPMESRPSKTTIPPMNFPDLNESMNSTQDGNVSEAPDFTCRRLSIKFFDDASDRKYKVFRVVMVKDDFIFKAELRRFSV